MFESSERDKLVAQILYIKKDSIVTNITLRLCLGDEEFSI
jgi:hypothetical protein